MANDIRGIVSTPPADDTVVVELDEDVERPIVTTKAVERLLSNHQIIKVKLRDDTEVEIDKDDVFVQFLVSPFELVGARGACLHFFHRGNAMLTEIECDNVVETDMSFEAFIDCYERDKLSMSAHTNPRDDLPLFLRYAACAFHIYLHSDSPTGISTMVILLAGARIFQASEAPWIVSAKRT